MYTSQTDPFQLSKSKPSSNKHRKMTIISQQQRSFMILDGGTQDSAPFPVYLQHNRLSTIPSSTNLNKELPPPPSPTSSNVSIPYSNIPAFGYPSSALPTGTLQAQQAIERPDSYTLPLTAANPNFFLPEPEGCDDFFPPDQNYAAQRRNVVNDRVRKWVEDPTSNTAPSTDDEQSLFVYGDEQDDGQVLSPAFQSPIWEYPTRGNVNAKILHHSDVHLQVHSTHHSLHPVLEFSIAALVGAPARSDKCLRPAHASVPLSVGDSDLASPVAATAPGFLDRFKVPNSAPPLLRQRVPLQLASLAPFAEAQEVDLDDLVLSPSSTLPSPFEHQELEHVEADVQEPQLDDSSATAASQNATEALASPTTGDRTPRKESDDRSGSVEVPMSLPSVDGELKRLANALASPAPSFEHGMAEKRVALSGQMSERRSSSQDSPPLCPRKPSNAASNGSAPEATLSISDVTCAETRARNRPDSLDTFGQPRSPACPCLSEKSSKNSEEPIRSSLVGSISEGCASPKPQPRSHSQSLPSERTLHQEIGFKPAEASHTPSIHAQAPLSSISIQSPPPVASTLEEPQTPLSVLKFARDDIRSSFASIISSCPRPRIVTVNTVPRSSEISATAVQSQTQFTVHIASAVPKAIGGRCIMTPIVERPSLSPSSSTVEPPGRDADSAQQSLSSLQEASDQGLYLGPFKSLPLLHDNDPMVPQPQSSGDPLPATKPSTALRSGRRGFVSHFKDLILDIQGLSQRSVNGVLGLITFFGSCRVLADREEIIKLCISTRDSIEAAAEAVKFGSAQIQDIVKANPVWRDTFHDRLCSLRRNLTRMAEFSETMVQRPPRLHRVQDALEKLKAYIAKFNNLSIKLTSSYERYRSQRTRVELVGARRAAKTSGHREHLPALLRMERVADGIR